MVHTLPPWTSKWRMATIFGQIDSGELAARLGALSTFDRRGKVFWYDDFESPLINWKQTLPGGRGAVTLSTDRSWMGGQSLKLVTGAVLNDYCWLTKSFKPPESSQLGIEFWVYAQNNDAILEVYLQGYSSTHYYQLLTEYNWENDTLRYYNSEGGPYTLTSALYKGMGLEDWVPIKMVLDWDTKKIMRIIVGGEQFDLSTEDLVSVAVGNNPHVQVWIIFSNTAAAAKTCYLDNFIFTQNEP